MTVQVRLMREDDWPQVLDIARGLAAWFRPTEQMTLAIDLRAHQGLVAAEGYRIVGFLTYHLLNAARAELSWFGIPPERQAHGVGRQLLADLEARLAARGVKVLQLSTVPSDHDAVFLPTNIFYEHRGFIVRQRDENFYSQGRPRILLEKELLSPEGAPSEPS
ncbi:MAG TPA: GNAT family N-acetyltransferase [Ardenticatenaceae bacterium]